MIHSLFAVAAIVMSAASTASAQELTAPSSSISVVVRTGDLDLSTQAGARQLLRRVHIAAASACNQDDPIFRSTDYVPCIAAATDQTVLRLANPIVAAVHNHNQTSEAVTVASIR